MTPEEPESLEDQLRALAASLATNPDPSSWSPEALALLGRIVQVLDVDVEVLQSFGYFSLEQACTRLCDLFEKGEIPRIRSFKHCGEEHPYHAFQTMVICPVCQTRFKTARFFGEDDPMGVALSALLWLGLDPRSVPGWNPVCEASFMYPTPGSPETRHQTDDA